MPEPVYDISALNGAAFSRAISSLAGDLADLSAPLATVARSTAVMAAASAPRLTGSLAGAHRTGPGRHNKGAAGITVDTVYALPLHWGWRMHGIGRRPWLVAAWRRDPGWPATLTRDVQGLIDKAAATT